MLLFVAALFAVTFASGVWCVVEALRVRGQGPKKTFVAAGLLLGTAVVAGGAFLRFVFVPAHHAMYVDEPWYAEAACNLARSGRLVLCEASWSGETCVPYEKAPGWPVLLAAWAWLRGCATSTGIDFNRVLGSATALLVAAAVRCAGGSWWQGFLVAVLIAIHPIHVAWSVTGETNVSAAAALLAGLCGVLLYVRMGRRWGAALAISALALATAIRPESFVAVVVSATLTVLMARVPRAERSLVGGAMVLVGAGALLAGLDLWAMNESISGGVFLSAGRLGQHLVDLARADSLRVHGVVLVLALGGAAMLLRAREASSAFLLAGTAVALAVVAIAYDRFSERMLLAPTVAALPLGAFALGFPARGKLWRITAPAVLLVSVGLLWREPLLSVSIPPSTQLLEMRITSRVGAVPFSRESLFVATQPTVLAATGMTRVMAMKEAVREQGNLERAIREGTPVYFLCDMFCEENFAGATSPAPCGVILDDFALSPVVRDTFDGRTYALYRITGPIGADSKAPDCPRRLRGSDT